MTATLGQNPTSPTSEAIAQTRSFWPAILALAWSLGMAVLALAWQLDLVSNPFSGSAGEIYGPMLTALDPQLGSGISLGFGLAAAGCALAALWFRTGRAGRITGIAAWAVPAVIVMTVLTGQLLMLLGYVFVVLAVGWAMPGMWPEFLTGLGQPELLFQLYGLAGALIWTVAAVQQGRALRDSCRSCGRLGSATPQQEQASRVRALRIGRAAVAVAVACLLVYPMLRLPWLVGIPVGMDASAWAQLHSEPEMLATGVALGGAAVAGAVLLIGLVRNWGVRFPFWMLGLSGRRVPITLGVLPAGIACLAFVAQGRGALLSALLATPSTPMDGVNVWLHQLAFAALLPGGLALAVATGAYAVRRRGPCATCNQGLPEALPRQPGATPSDS